MKRAKLKLSAGSLIALQKLITGDIPQGFSKSITPYRSGPKLVSFFSDFGPTEPYSMNVGFPSRWKYADDKLVEFNDTSEMAEIIEAVLSPVHFLHTSFDHAVAVDYLNKYLEFDGLRVSVSGNRCRVQHLGGVSVETEASLSVLDSLSHDYIREQVEKCDKKVAEEDYDGAITNARSLTETVLFEIEKRLDLNQQPYDGDLQKLYKRVQKLLNLEPERPDISESLKFVLRGLSNIIAGLAPLRNKMGDAHVRSHKPERHHAKLAVNSAKTLTDFVIDSFEYQQRTGKIVVAR